MVVAQCFVASVWFCYFACISVTHGLVTIRSSIGVVRYEGRYTPPHLRDEYSKYEDIHWLVKVLFAFLICFILVPTFGYFPIKIIVFKLAINDNYGLLDGLSSWLLPYFWIEIK